MGLHWFPPQSATKDPLPDIPADVETGIFVDTDKDGNPTYLGTLWVMMHDNDGQGWKGPVQWAGPVKSYLLITHGHDGTRFQNIHQPHIPEDHQMRRGETAYVVEVLDTKRERA